MAAKIKPKLIGIAGGSASCKTTIAKALAARLPGSIVIGEDDYYRCSTSYPSFDASTHNFDEPAAKDDELLCAHLALARAGKPFEKPLYNLKTHTREKETERVGPADFMIVEGLHVLATQALCASFDLRIYTEAEESLRLGRRMIRDVMERDRTPQSVLTQFFTNVRPMHELHVAPQKPRADLVLTSTFEGGYPETDRNVEKVLATLGVS